MKRKALIGLTLVLTLALVSACGIPQEDYDTAVADADAARAQVSSLQSDLSKAKSDLSEAKSDLTAAQSEVESLQANLDKAKSDLSSAKSDLSSTTSQLASAESDLSAAQGDLAAAEAELAAAQAELAAIHEQIAELEAATTPAEAEAAEAEFWPTEGWLASTPEEQDMDSAKLDQVAQYIDERSLAIDSVLVVRHGYIVLEEYPQPRYDQDTVHVVHSVTKSFASALIGIAIREGYIDGTEQKMVDLFPERTIENLDSRKESVTLEDMLTMKAGLEWNEWKYAYTDPRNDYIKAVYLSSDPVQYVLDLPMMEDPGVRWNYNGGTSHLLSALIAESTGYDTLDFAREFLFGPLGISDVSWGSDRHGIYYGGGGLYLTPRDMAKFGYLYLHNGTWEDQQVVPADFVAESVKTHHFFSASSGYGYQSWWTYPQSGLYSAAGLYGQKIYVVPDLDMVVVFTADIKDADPDLSIREILFDYIIAACD